MKQGKDIKIRAKYFLSQGDTQILVDRQDPKFGIFDTWISPSKAAFHRGKNIDFWHQKSDFWRQKIYFRIQK